jgi:hypothetical protein
VTAAFGARAGTHRALLIGIDHYCLKDAPEGAVLRWKDSQGRGTLFPAADTDREPTLSLRASLRQWFAQPTRVSIDRQAQTLLVFAIRHAPKKVLAGIAD